MSNTYNNNDLIGFSKRFEGTKPVRYNILRRCELCGVVMKSPFVTPNHNISGMVFDTLEHECEFIEGQHIGQHIAQARYIGYIICETSEGN